MLRARGEPLRSVDAAWLRLDTEDNGADVVALLRLQGRLRPARLRELVEARLLPHRRFRERVEDGGLVARWVDDARLTLDDRVLHAEVDGEEGLRAFAGEVASTRLDPARAPWRLWLVDGAGDGSALVAHLHHCLADGFALVALLLSLADGADEPRASAHRLPAARALRLLDPRRALADAARAPALAPRLAAEAAATAAALGRMALLRRPPESVLSRPLSGRRAVAWSRPAPLAAVRQAARGAGATVNDVLLAAVAGALREWLGAEGERVDRLPVRALLPVNLRPGLPEAGDLGNRFGLVYADLPVALAGRAERLRAIRADLSARKAAPDALATYAALAAMGSVPGRVERALGSFFSRKASIVVTNVPGPRHPLRVAGLRLERAMFWVPHPLTIGLGVSILTYAGEVHAGVRADRAIADPRALVAALERELAALAPG